MSGVWSERPTGESNRSAQTLHRAEVHVLRRAGVSRRALQDHKRRAGLAKRSDDGIDVLEPRHPRGDEHGLPGRGDRLDDRRVRHLAGRDLVRRGIDLLEEVDRGHRERGREEEQAELLGGRLQREVVVLRQLHALRELVPRLVEVRRRRRRGKHLRVRDVRLELHGVRAGFGRSANEGPCLAETSIVVVPDFGDDQRRPAGPERASSEVHEGCDPSRGPFSRAGNGRTPDRARCRCRATAPAASGSPARRRRPGDRRRSRTAG